MTNHVHLVASPGHTQSMAKTLREVHGRYAQYRNALDRSTGHVWQSRYYSCAVEGVRVAGVMRYVELNPVRAGMVRSASDYVWSSAVAHLGGIDPLGLLDLKAWRETWSQREWAEMLGQTADDGAAIREATYSGRPLGSVEFVAGLEMRLNRKLARGHPGRPAANRLSAVG